MRLKFTSISSFIGNLRKSVLGIQYRTPPPKDDSPVTKDEFSSFVKELGKGFIDIAEDLKNLERELGRKQNSP